MTEHPASSGGLEVPLKGQWLGSYSGSSTGSVVVNIDDRVTYHEGVAYLLEKDRATLPNVAAAFSFFPDANHFQCRTSWISPLHPVTGSTDSWDNLRSMYPDGTEMSTHADIEGRWDAEALTISWKTNVGAHGSCVLPRSEADQPSELVPREEDWAGYKKYTTTLEGRRYLFRGQAERWRLRTSFHRAGRANLIRFVGEDIQSLHRQLSARTKHVFNLTSGDENGAFFNLVQHHGYPTPLLDWTYSPYVAAFFAYRNITNGEAEGASSGDKVRIHVFDQRLWQRDFHQPLNVLRADAFVSISEFLAIENERMIPQQAASTITNLDDIESYIRFKEGTANKQYLWAIDLPVSERRQVIEELSYMGITAGSMFPGLEGACEELRERNFDI